MSPTAAATLIVGLNGALQKRFVLPPNTPLIPGNVHRASHVQVGVGGKGQDVAVTLSCLQYTPPLLLVQFIGSGAEGDVVYKMLHDLLAHNNHNHHNHDVSAMELTVRTNSAMRTCTSIVASDVTTELVEPSGLVTSAEWQELLEKLETKEADAMCFMGSMPPGCPDDAYAKIYQIVARPHTLCLIDSVAGLGPLLEMIATIKEQSTSSSPTGHSAPTGGSSSTTASSAYSTMLKINASELCRLGNVKKRTDETGGVQKDELVAAVQSLVRAYPAARAALHAIAITDGPHPAYFVVMPVSGESEMRLFQLPVAKLPLDPDEDMEESMTSSLAPAGGSGGGWGQWSESNASLEKMPDHHHPPPTPAPSLKTTTTLYPIGAGDAVAAGTLGAWKTLSHKPRQASSWQQPSNTPLVGCLAPEIQQVLIGNESPGATSRARVMLTSFSFGLACGSASCLQEQNSVVQIQDALDLYIREGRPMFLSSDTLSSS